MLQLELTPREASILVQTLDTVLQELRTEISHTDSHDYKEQLKERQSVLERTRQALADLAGD
ncbi:MAG TPA: hypothetical protein VFL93_05480 [Longimicrobiaceae bacterium]|nr:hypothetical protein [Longimicrobiaceae bacterium]